MRGPAYRLAFATVSRTRTPADSSGQDLWGAVCGAVQEVEDDALSEAALADLQRLAEKLGELLEQEDAAGQDANPARVELEALRDLGDRVACEDPDRPLQGLVLEHRADQRAQRGGASSHGHRLGRLLELHALEELGDLLAHRPELRRRRWIVAEEVVGERAGADLEGMDLANPVADPAEHHLGRPAADIDDTYVAFNRVSQGLGRADEGKAALLLLAEHLHLHPGDSVDL